MSGGSYDYAFRRIDELADAIQATTPLRRAFQQHLRDVAKAAHDIEWVDSCDYGKGDEDEAIQKVLGQNAPTLALREILTDLRKTAEQITETLDVRRWP